VGKRGAWVPTPTGFTLNGHACQWQPTAALITAPPPPVTASATATPASYTADIGTPKAITLAGSDPENGALTYTVVTQPTKGTLTPTGTTTTGNRTYTPVTAGSDSFTFYVTDPLGAQSTLATVTITVQAPPVAFAQSVAVTRDTAKPITLQGEAEPGFTITAWTIVRAAAQPTVNCREAVARGSIRPTLVRWKR
jgi:hypothetical protein